MYSYLKKEENTERNKEKGNKERRYGTCDRTISFREGVGANFFPSAHATGNENDAAAAAVRGLLASLGQQGAQEGDKPYPRLSHLLVPPVTIGSIEHIARTYPERLDILLNNLPPGVIIMASNPNPAAYDGKTEPSAEAVQQAIASMTLTQKRDILKKIVRTPQFSLALEVLTNGIREGGLPSVAGALGIPVRNGGYLVRGGNVPLGGGHAVEAFLQGVKKSVQDNNNI